MENRFQALTGLFILVVEDEAIVAMTLEDTLRDFGCDVALAGSIEDALVFVRGNTPDGVLLDMNLHGQNTISVAEELASRSVPFLLVTGYDASEDDPPIIKAAPRLQKPFNEDLLGRRLTEVFVEARRS